MRSALARPRSAGARRSRPGGRRTTSGPSSRTRRDPKRRTRRACRAGRRRSTSRGRRGRPRGRANGGAGPGGGAGRRGGAAGGAAGAGWRRTTVPARRQNACHEADDDSRRAVAAFTRRRVVRRIAGHGSPSHACGGTVGFRRRSCPAAAGGFTPRGPVDPKVGPPLLPDVDPDGVGRSVDGLPRRQDSAYPGTADAGCKLVNEGRGPIFETALRDGRSDHPEGRDPGGKRPPAWDRGHTACSSGSPRCTVWYMRYQTSTTTPAEPDRLWAVLSDVERCPARVDRGYEEVRLADSGPLTVGARAHVKQRGLAAGDWTVTDLDEGRVFAWESAARRTPGRPAHGERGAGRWEPAGTGVRDDRCAVGRDGGAAGAQGPALRRPRVRAPGRQVAAEPSTA